MVRSPKKTGYAGNRFAQTTANIRIKPDRGRISEMVAHARQLRDGGQYDKALAVCNQAAGMFQNNADIRFMMASIMELNADHDGAANAYAHARDLAPDKSSGLVQLAAIKSDIDNVPDALMYCQEAVNADHASLDGLRALGHTFMKLARPGEAVPHFEKVVALGGNAVDRIALGVVHQLAGHNDAAQTAYAAALKAGGPAAWINVQMGRNALEQDDHDRARAYFNAALKADPRFPLAHYYLASERPGDLQAQIEHAREALTGLGANGQSPQAAPLHFALSRLFEQQGETKKALDHLSIANRLIASAQAVNPADLDGWIAHCRQAFQPGAMDAYTGWGLETSQPVFVFGLPCSGISAVEAIIAAHPDAASIGPAGNLDWLGFYLGQNMSEERVKTAARLHRAAIPEHMRNLTRVADCTPDHYLRVGLLLILFPNAYLIHCRRDPLQAAFAMYRHMFDVRTATFSTSYDRIARHMRQYEALMEIWQDLIPGRILDIQLEDMHRDRESCARRIIDHIGLEWNAACLEAAFPPEAGTHGYDDLLGPLADLIGEPAGKRA